MLPSSWSGSTAGVAQPAAIAEESAAAAIAPRMKGFMATDYHNAVGPTLSRTIRIVTYNIHRCRGLDGRVRPERTAAVLRAIGADVIALQEVVGSGPHGRGH